MIDRETVNKLEMLARIRMNDEQKDALVTDLQQILGYVDQITSVDVSEEVTESYAVMNVTRADEDPHNPAEYTADIVAGFPEKQDNYLKVPKVLRKEK